MILRIIFAAHSNRSLRDKESRQSHRPDVEIMKELQSSLKTERMRNDRLMKLIEQKVQNRFAHDDNYYYECP